MKILSNGQFDVIYREYLFDPQSKKFIPIDKLPITHYFSSSVMLKYRSFDTVDSDLKSFELELLNNGKHVKRVDGMILKSGPNENYENIVKNMIREASALTKLNELEDLENPSSWKRHID